MFQEKRSKATIDSFRIAKGDVMHILKFLYKTAKDKMDLLLVAISGPDPNVCTRSGKLRILTETGKIVPGFKHESFVMYFWRKDASCYLESLLLLGLNADKIPFPDPL